MNGLYYRTLLQHDDRWLIHSTCRRCGQVIVGSISDKLHDDEMDHAERCQPAKKAASSSSSDPSSSSSAA